MAEVDVFLTEEWPALGDSEILKKQLKQCRVRFFFFLCNGTKGIKKSER